MAKRMKWYLDKSLCWLLDHRWRYQVIPEQEFFGPVDIPWCVCGRCAEARKLEDKLPACPAARRWLIACAIVFLLIGHRLGSINRSPDLPRVELAQAEIRRDLDKLRKLEDLEKLIDRYFQERERIITRNRRAFVRPAVPDPEEE